MSRQTHTPDAAWRALQEGNERFVSGQVEHPSQGAEHRRQVSAEQRPFAVIFGCSDSRVAAEIIFDQGLGDLFVVRTAGHVIDTTIIGSIEYGVDVLGASLVVVLGHDKCGALQATIDALTTGRLPGGFVRAVVDRVIPSLIAKGDLEGEESSEHGERHIRVPGDDDLRRQHVRATVQTLRAYSLSLTNAIAEGRCAVIGVEYDLAEGRARVVE